MSSDKSRSVKLTINGNSYLVEIDNLNASPLAVKVNGQAYTVHLETDEAEVASPGKVEAVSHNAAPHPTTPEPVTPPTMAPNGSDQKAVKSPMPGNITTILVKPGDHVSMGQELCSLEAMKMNNAIRSPYDGVIATVVVALGQTVKHGDILLTFE